MIHWLLINTSASVENEKLYKNKILILNGIKIKHFRTKILAIQCLLVLFIGFVQLRCGYREGTLSQQKNRTLLVACKESQDKPCSFGKSPLLILYVLDLRMFVTQSPP